MSSSVIGSAETAPRLLTAEKFCGKGIGDSTSSPSALGDMGTALDPWFESWKKLRKFFFNLEIDQYKHIFAYYLGILQISDLKLFLLTQ